MIKYQLTLGKILAWMSTKSELLKIVNETHFSDIRLSVEDCLHNGNCGELEKYNEGIETKPIMMDVSSHPVHIVNEEGELNPSALIPFCQIGGNYFGELIAP